MGKEHFPFISKKIEISTEEGQSPEIRVPIPKGVTGHYIHGAPSLALHALFLIGDVAKFLGLLSPNFSGIFRAAVPYLSLIFCPFLYPCVSYDFIRILKFSAASLQNEKSIFCLLLISILPLASLIFSEISSPVSYWPSLINNIACRQEINDQFSFWVLLQ